MRQMRMAVALMLTAALALGAASCKDNMAPSLLEHMGGIDGVAKLMDNWKGAMAADAQLANVLTEGDRDLCPRQRSTFAQDASRALEMDRYHGHAGS